MELKFSHFDYNDNLTQQRELFKDCFPETNGELIQQEIYYKWKFHSFPNEVTSWEYASYIEKDMVGYYAAIPYRYKIGDKQVSVGMVCDVMTSSKYRGKGIFTKMGSYSTTELSSHVPFTMGYPIRKEVIPGHLKVGWKIPFSLPLYMKFIRFDSLFKVKKVGFLAPLANIAIGVLNAIWKTKISKEYTFSLSNNIQDVIGYDEFAHEWSSSVANSLIKDIDFARWRYSAPGKDYSFLALNNTVGKLIGFVAIRKIIKEGVPSFGILDYMVLKGSENVHGLINKVLVDLAKREKVEAIMTMMSSASAQNYRLLSNGFFKSPFVFQLIIKNLTNEFTDDELFNENDWHLMWVDSDDL
jgi:hypothetical protein